MYFHKGKSMVQVCTPSWCRNGESCVQSCSASLITTYYCPASPGNTWMRVTHEAEPGLHDVW